MRSLRVLSSQYVHLFSSPILPVRHPSVFVLTLLGYLCLKRGQLMGVRIRTSTQHLGDKKQGRKKKKAHTTRTATSGNTRQKQTQYQKKQNKTRTLAGMYDTYRTNSAHQDKRRHTTETYRMQHGTKRVDSELLSKTPHSARKEEKREGDLRHSTSARLRKKQHDDCTLNSL